MSWYHPDKRENQYDINFYGSLNTNKTNLYIFLNKPLKVPYGFQEKTSFTYTKIFNLVKYFYLIETKNIIKSTERVFSTKKLLLTDRIISYLFDLNKFKINRDCFKFKLNYYHTIDACNLNNGNKTLSRNVLIKYIKQNIDIKKKRFKTFEIEKNRFEFGLDVKNYRISDELRRKQAYVNHFDTRYNFDKIKIHFVDFNMYFNYAVKLGYKGKSNNFAALFVDFKV